MKRNFFGTIVAALVAGVAFSGCSILSPAYRDNGGVVTASASVVASALKVGDCLASIPTDGASVTKLPVVPCSTPHEGEVYAVASKMDNVPDAIVAYCEQQFQPYVGSDWNNSNLEVTYISAESSVKTTDVQCIVYSSGQMVTSSYKNSQE